MGPILHRDYTVDYTAGHKSQASSSEALLFHTPPNQNATVSLKLRAPNHDFFTPLSIRRLHFTSSFELRSMTFSYPAVRMLLCTSSLELRSMIFSHPSQSESNVAPQALSSEARLLHTPLSQNATLYLKPRAPEHDFFTPLSVRIERRPL